ncbi:MAG TPA: VOC family protein [Rhizomicrobium sp.]|jgi:predicted 3-demethylubiquinone-9 3-methyltransferase (glyoxalase superfamily)|nr:VOC family protein [Rhizomicrobium sp.]
MQKITPFLWFDGKAGEAAEFYKSVFEDVKILETQYYNEAGPLPKGTVLTVTFEIFGQEFVALNGGPHYQFTPAVSFSISCENQEELDGYWEKLAEGGIPMQCGWISDKFGVTWQIVPRVLSEMLEGKDGDRAARVMRAMFQMVKLDIAGLKRAYDEA